MIGKLLTGRYLILEQLRSGSLTETYLARDKYLLHHPLCVVKCLRLSSNQAISLETAQHFFETEARILNELGTHPQIPSLLAYCHEPELVYLVQEHIEGETLAEWFSQERPLSASGAIALLSEILPVLHYLHRHQVIHCDIKPSHIIQRQKDGKFVLIDFGVARFLSATNSNPDLKLAVGTPGYMPEEQHQGEVAFHSDLYALGMTVIHLLTQKDPNKFERDLISGELYWQDSLPEGKAFPPLVHMLERMVRSRPRDRYQTALEVSRALGQITSPHRPWPKRIDEWKKAIVQTHPLNRLKPLLAVLLLGVAGGHFYPTLSHRATLLQGWLKNHFHTSVAELQILNEHPIPSATEQIAVDPNGIFVVTTEAGGLMRLWSLPQATALRTLQGHTGSVTEVAMSEDGKMLVSGSHDYTVRLWNTSSGELVRVFRGHQQPVVAVALSPNQKKIASGSQDGNIRVWDLETGMLVQNLELHQVSITAITFGLTSDQLISASSDRQIHIWNLRTGEIERVFSGHTAPILHLQKTETGTLLSLGEDRMLMWNLNLEELVQVSSEFTTVPLVATLNDRHLLTFYEDGRMQVWVYQNGRLKREGSNNIAPVQAVAIAPELNFDPQFLVSLTPQHRLRVWQVDID